MERFVKPDSCLASQTHSSTSLDGRTLDTGRLSRILLECQTASREEIAYERRYPALQSDAQNGCRSTWEAIIMIETMISDLAEVLVSGMHGVEVPLARRLGVAQDGLLRQLGGEVFLDLMRGKVTEDAYHR